MSHEKIIVFCTAKDNDEAEDIAMAIVKEGLAACVNIVPKVKSIYRWKGKIEESDEVLMLIKTSRGLFDALSRWIKEMHSYEVPEIVAVEPRAVLPEYEAWWDEQLSDPDEVEG